MFGNLDDIHIDPKSGRPLAPLSFRTAGTWMALGSAMSALLLVITIMAARDQQVAWAAVTGLVSFMIFGFVLWRRREISTKRANFEAAVRAYESIRYPHMPEQDSGSGA